MRSIRHGSFVLFLAACTGGSGNSAEGFTPQPDAGSPGEPADGSTDGGTGKPSTPKEKCEALIACVADTDPNAAGGFVTLYGDASNCWKGSATDAEACGKACAQALEDRPECTAQPLDGTFVALCEGAPTNEPFRMEVRLTYSHRDGGTATFRALPIEATTYRSTDALTTLPKMTLEAETGGGEGVVTTTFDVPSEAFIAGQPGQSFTFERFAVKRLRVEETGTCSGLEASITSPFPTGIQGSCVYLSLAQGATIPQLTASKIRNCTP